jgi:glycosyltransferase involved in cell wall biosynthesis
VLSPICWFEPGALWTLEQSRLRSLAAWSLRRLVPGLPGWRRELLHLVDRVLPNSEAEARQLRLLFGIDPARIQVVPNGVLPSFRSAAPTIFCHWFGERDFVLFVGRIEPRKNLLGLIRAVRSVGVELVVIGDPPPECRVYYEHCRREGGDRVLWLAARDHHDPLLASAYSAARVFALPSWFETPGLAALEAALAGTAVVITPFGSTQEYFGDRVLYARPNRVTEIATAVSLCWSNGADPRLADFIASNYLWPDVAKKTAEVYDQVA